MLDNYVSIIDQIKEAVLSFEYGDDLFIMDSDFTRFRFKTDGDLIYNKKINIPVCVISLKKEIFIIHNLNYKSAFMKVTSSQKIYKR